MNLYSMFGADCVSAALGVSARASVNKAATSQAQHRRTLEMFNAFAAGYTPGLQWMDAGGAVKEPTPWERVKAHDDRLNRLMSEFDKPPSVFELARAEQELDS